MNSSTTERPHLGGRGANGELAIHAVSLSGSVMPERLAAGATRLAQLGAIVTSPTAATAEWRYFAGTDDERLAALDAALKSDAAMVMFTRGGYGLSRLLHRIDWHAVAASKKLFCGYSDVTAFNLAALAEAHTINGTLWGTNLAMIANMVGTRHMPKIDDGILVLEDVTEAPYRVERMFWQLKHAGILDKQRAIILAEFSDCEPTSGMRYPYSMTEAIETLREIAPCPVLTGFPFGHVPAKVTLPIGAAASVVIDGPRYLLSVRDYLR